jgi:hypothetical protein
MYAKKIFDQQQASGAPNLKDCPPKDRLFHVRYINWQILVTGAKAAPGAAAIDLASWLKNSRLDTWYRAGDARTFRKLHDNISLMGLSALGAIDRDGTLVESDAEVPRSVTATGGGVVDTFTFHLRQYFSKPTAELADDWLVSLSDLGDQQFNFSTFDPGAVFLATNIQVVGMAFGSYKRQYTCVPRLRVYEVGSRTPQLTDEISLGGNRCRDLVFFSQDAASSPVTTNTFPRVKVDQVYVVEGDRYANLGDIARNQGEIAYPQSGASAAASQRAYAPTQQCPIIQQDPDAHLSELPLGDEIELVYSASTATAGDQFLAVCQVEPLSDQEFAARAGVPVTGTAKAADGSQNVPSAIEPWLPRRV